MNSPSYYFIQILRTITKKMMNNDDDDDDGQTAFATFLKMLQCIMGRRLDEKRRSSIRIKDDIKLLPWLPNEKWKNPMNFLEPLLKKDTGAMILILFLLANVNKTFLLANVNKKSQRKTKNRGRNEKWQRMTVGERDLGFILLTSHLISTNRLV